MKSLDFFRSVCKWGHVLFSILRVLTIIASVCILIGIFTLALVPKNFFTLDIITQMEMKFNLAELVGEDWTTYSQELQDELLTSLPEGAKYTENGLEISQITPSETVENKTLALSLVPDFVESILFFSLFLYLCRIFKALKESPDPLCAPVAENLRFAGGLVMALGIVPALSASLVRLLTGTSQLLSDTSFDLWLIFLGFLLWAAADLFLYAASTRNPNPFNNNTF